MRFVWAIGDTVEWIIRSPRAWVIVISLAVYVRTSFVTPDAAVLGVTGGAVLVGVVAHLWSEAKNGNGG